VPLGRGRSRELQFRRRLETLYRRFLGRGRSECEEGDCRLESVDQVPDKELQGRRMVAERSDMQGKARIRQAAEDIHTISNDLGL
jgi:hypothetical protein